MEPDNNTFLTALRTGQTWNYSISIPAEYIDHTFKIGDIVVLRTGTAPQKVTAVRGNKIKTEYLNSRKQHDFRAASDYQLYEYVTPYLEEETDNMKNKLFKTIETNRFGTGLAIDSDGKYVLKMQDSGNFESFEEKDLKRVMPYTFDVTFVGGDGNRGTRYSYRGREGQVAVGDILILNDSFSIARVVAINTESESATKTFNGSKLQTVALD